MNYVPLVLNVNEIPHLPFKIRKIHVEYYEYA